MLAPFEVAGGGDAVPRDGGVAADAVHVVERPHVELALLALASRRPRPSTGRPRATRGRAARRRSSRRRPGGTSALAGDLPRRAGTGARARPGRRASSRSGGRATRRRRSSGRSRRRGGRRCRPTPWRRATSAPSSSVSSLRVVVMGAQQQVEHRRLRELRGAAEAAPCVVVLGPQHAVRALEQLDAEMRLARPGRPAACATRSPAAISSAWPTTASRRSCHASRIAIITSVKLGMPCAALGGKYVPPKNGSAVGREEHRHRPAAAAGHRLHGLHVDGVDVGPLLAVDLHVDEQLVHHRRRWRRPRRTRAPSRGTSGTPSSRPRAGSACRSSRAAAKASSPHGYQSTGLSLCWRRYGLVSSGQPVHAHSTI